MIFSASKRPAEICPIKITKLEERELFYRHSFFVNKYPTTVVKYFLFLKNPYSQSTIEWKYKRFYYITFSLRFFKVGCQSSSSKYFSTRRKVFWKGLRLAIPTLICWRQPLKMQEPGRFYSQSQIPIGRKDMQTICVFQKSCIWKVSFRKSR